MRRLISFIGITMLALLVCGGGSALAAALCPHAWMHQPPHLTKEHSCHGTKLETPENRQHHQGGHHEAAPVAQRESAINLPVQDGDEAFLGQPASKCTHCMGQSPLPLTPASVREVVLQNQDAGKSVVNKTELITLPSVAVAVSRFVPSQHAPPGRDARQHLIHCVFLI